MSVKIEFGATDTGLGAMSEQMRKSAEKLGHQYLSSAKAVAEVGRAAQRGFERARTPLERYNKRMEDLKRLLEQGKIRQEQFDGAALDAKQSLEKQGQAGTSALRNIAGQLTGVVGGYLTLQGALNAIVGTYQTWIKNAREAAEESRKAAGETASFLALQEGGTAAERAGRVQRAALEFGVTERGVAYDTVQALQSIRGDFEQGLEAGRQVFEASLAGIPVELGRELEVFGASAGAQVGQFLRLAFAGGQLSGRDPEALARAAPAVGFFRDPTIGFAAAAQIAGTVREEQIETFTKAAGIALSEASDAQQRFADAGLATAGEIERLRYLQEQGITTPAQLKEFGIGEIRQQQAVAALIPRINELSQVQIALQKSQLDTNLLAQERAEIERVSPQAVVERGINQAIAGFQEAQSADMESMLNEFRERTLALELQRRGLTQVGPFDIIEGGRTSFIDRLQADLALTLTRGVRHPTSEAFRQAVQSTEEQVQGMREQLEESRSQTELLRQLNDNIQNVREQQYRERRQRAAAASPP